MGGSETGCSGLARVFGIFELHVHGGQRLVSGDGRTFLGNDADDTYRLAIFRIRRISGTRCAAVALPNHAALLGRGGIQYDTGLPFDFQCPTAKHSLSASRGSQHIRPRSRESH